ncbi:hypothetical protein ACFWJ5_18165 [Streptomyces qaidamensis]|uniref:hypothetical protein n=1 Tax=Streptomyces qaidamensis TaxID=1783515 RepID=UPI0036612883
MPIILPGGRGGREKMSREPAGRDEGDARAERALFPADFDTAPHDEHHLHRFRFHAHGWAGSVPTTQRRSPKTRGELNSGTPQRLSDTTVRYRVRSSVGEHRADQLCGTEIGS